MTHHKLSDKWVRVAEELNVPDHVLNSIVASRLKDDEASLRKVIEWWFKNTANPEWSTIQRMTIQRMTIQRVTIQKLKKGTTHY